MKEILAQTAGRLVEEIFKTIEKVGMSNVGKTAEELFAVLKNGTLEYDVPYTSNEIMVLLGLKSKETLRRNYLNPAIEEGLVRMTLPDKPNSKNQRYVKQ